MSDKIKKTNKGVSRRSVIKSAAAGAAFVAAGPALFNIANAQGKTIKIGMPVPLTGPYGKESQEQARCAQIAVDQFNAAGGLNGRMAELLPRDTKLKAGEAATRTLELIEKDGADFICGSLSASVQLAINNVTKERKKIFMSISQSDGINEAKHFSKYTFHEAMNPHMTAGAVGRYVFPRNKKRVAFLIADYAYGHEMARGFIRAGKEHGIEVVAQVKHPLATKDFSPFLPQIQAAKPDVLCLCNFGYDQLNSLKQSSNFGMKEQMLMVAPALLYSQRLSGGADPYEGVIGGTNYHWTLENGSASSKAFNDAYRKSNKGMPPSDYGGYGFSGVASLLKAVKVAGSSDTDAVIAALEGLKYDNYKGGQHYRGCDHQSVQDVHIIASKSQKDMKNDYDLFDILHTDKANEGVLRTCDELASLK